MSIETETTDEVKGILNRVAGWPTGVRVSLAQKILRTVEEDLKPEPTRRKSFMSLLGRLKIEGPPPTDEQCQAMLEEELIKKYGS